MNGRPGRRNGCLESLSRILRRRLTSFPISSRSLDIWMMRLSCRVWSLWRSNLFQIRLWQSAEREQPNLTAHSPRQQRYSKLCVRPMKLRLPPKKFGLINDFSALAWTNPKVDNHGNRKNLRDADRERH